MRRNVARTVGLTREQAQRFLEEHKIRYVLAQFVDIHGAAKAKAVPVEHLDMVLTDGAGFAGFALWGFGMGPEGPDYMAVGDLSTLQAIPWMPGYARLDLQRRSQPKVLSVLLAGRAASASCAAQRSADSLCTPVSSRSSCCYRGARTEVWGPPTPRMSWISLVTTTRDLYRTREVLDEMVAGLRAVGIDVYQIDHEDGNGQFEINFTYADALKSADNFTFVKMAASEIAHKHGMIATFMPKPFSNRTGSGAHFHVSLGSAEQKNAFHDPNDKSGMGLSPMAYHFLGGVLAHARAFCAVAAPTVNSYKRLVVGRSLSGATWAPAYIAYGDNNRTACVRVPYGRLEVRLPDSGCNPYLVSAALIAAGLDGIDRKIDPGPAQNINLYELSVEELAAKGIKLLPQSLERGRRCARGG